MGVVREGNGIRARPEHIHQALRIFAGIDEHKFSGKFPLNVSENDRLQDLFG